MPSPIRDNIRSRMNKAGLSMRELSKKAGLGQTAVRDIIEGFTKSPRGDTLEAIAKALGCHVRDLYAEPHEHFRREVVPLPIIGDVQAGVWKDAIEWPRSDWQYEPVPEDPRFGGYSRFGLLVRGTSMNQIYEEGDFVVCVPMIELQEEPEHGRRYVVYRKNSKNEVEATLKEYEIDEDGKHWLVPRSDDVRFKTPIEMENGETTDIEIFARVVGHWRREK